MDIEKIKKKVIDFYHSKKKIVWALGGLLVITILASTILPLLSNPQGDETDIQYGEVIRGSLTETIDVVGTLQAVPSATLSWESVGIVDVFEVEVGDKISKDDVLMTLTDDSLDSAILEAQASLLDAEVTLENLKKTNTDLYNATQTLADAEYALRQYKSDRDYYNRKGASDEAIDAVRSAYYDAKQVVWEKEIAYDALADLESDDPQKVAAYDERKTAIEARDKALRNLNNLLGVYYDYGVETNFIDYDLGLAAVEEARVAYKRYLNQDNEIAAAEASVQALQNTINTGRIIAPFDGTVTSIEAVAGELVASGDEAIRLDNLESLMVNVSISEVDINKVMVGQKAVITFDAIADKVYSGFVDSIATAGVEDSNGVVQFSVWVKVEDSDSQVKPGFTSVVSIITSQVEDALLVPNDAIISRDGSTMVEIYQRVGENTLVKVEVGASSDLYTEIISGEIEEGEQVVLYSSSESEMFGPGMMMQGPGGGAGGGQPPADMPNR